MSASSEQQAPSYGDELVVRVSKGKILLLDLMLTLACTVVFQQIFGFLPTFQPSPARVVAYVILFPVGILVILSLIGLLSPFPAYTVSHEGIRQFSLFGWFGNPVTPWSEVRTIVIYTSRGVKYLVITAVHSRSIGWSRALPQHLRSRVATPVVRISVSSSILAGSIDELYAQIQHRYRSEIAEYRIETDRTTLPPPEPPIASTPLRRAFAYVGASVGCLLLALALNVVAIRLIEAMHRGGNLTAENLARMDRWVVFGLCLGEVVCGLGAGWLARRADRSAEAAARDGTHVPYIFVLLRMFGDVAGGGIVLVYGLLLLFLLYGFLTGQTGPLGVVPLSSL